MHLNKNIQKIRQQIQDAEQKHNREPNSVLLLAVSKQQSAETIEKAYQCGITDFGENYLQEAETKIKQLAHLNIKWHFIGSIQSNKTKSIANHFDWVHSINRVNVAKRLNDYRPLNLAPLNVCLHINIVDEDNKAGVKSEEAAELVQAISQLPHLQLRGLMTILPLDITAEEQYTSFLALNKLLYHLNKQFNLKMDTLSMGMSNDMIPAIEAGSTIVRIGRAIFGERMK